MIIDIYKSVKALADIYRGHHDARVRRRANVLVLKMEKGKGEQQMNLVPRAECSACHEVMSSTDCVPAILACGHVATCVSCYEKWNKGKHLKICPICKHSQTASPISVVADFESQQEATIKIRVNYIASFTQRKVDETEILCKMSSSGDDIKKILLPCLPQFNFPNEYLSFCFSTQGRPFPFHGNTTLNDIGFTPTTHSIFIQEDSLPIESELVQQRLKLLEQSPDGKFKIFLRATPGLELNACQVKVEKHYTMSYLASRVGYCLAKIKNESHIGKKVVLNLPGLGVTLTAEMTVEELRINTKTPIYFALID